MKKLKVTVEGLITATFVGFDVEVEAFLTNIKKQQDSLVSIDDLKAYRKDMPPFKQSHLNMFGTTTKYNIHAREYGNPGYKLELFREKYKPNGLKIKIEPFIDTNEFF